MQTQAPYSIIAPRLCGLTMARAVHMYPGRNIPQFRALFWSPNAAGPSKLFIVYWLYSLIIYYFLNIYNVLFIVYSVLFFLFTYYCLLFIIVYSYVSQLRTESRSGSVCIISVASDDDSNILKAVARRRYVVISGGWVEMCQQNNESVATLLQYWQVGEVILKYRKCKYGVVIIASR